MGKHFQSPKVGDDEKAAGMEKDKGKESSVLQKTHPFVPFPFPLYTSKRKC